MNNRKIKLLATGIILIIAGYLTLMTYFNEHSIGLWQSIVETETVDELVRKKELLRIQGEYITLTRERYIYFATLFTSLFLFLKFLFKEV